MPKSLKLIIEALLFATDKPLTARDIRACLPETPISEIKSALKVLTYEYEAMGRSFSLKEVAEGFQLRTQSEYGTYILKFLQTTPNRLSRAAMETLAIIAYKQPILRQDIERYRGVDVGGILKTLLEKGLIRIMGRKDLPGRPLIYGTTRKFLEVFDLKDLKSLPKLKEIQSLGSDEFDPQPFEQLTLKGISTDQETTKEEPELSEPIEIAEDGAVDTESGKMGSEEAINEDFSNEIETQEPAEGGPDKDPEEATIQECGAKPSLTEEIPVQEYGYSPSFTEEIQAEEHGYDPSFTEEIPDDEPRPDPSHPEDILSEETYSDTSGETKENGIT